MSSAFLLYGIALVYGATGSTNLVDDRAVPHRQRAARERADARRPRAAARRVSASRSRRCRSTAGCPTCTRARRRRSPASWPRPRRRPRSPRCCGSSTSPSTPISTTGSRSSGCSRCSAWSSARCSPIIQTDVKRMLAYSSISHAGFILVGVQAASALGTAAALFYLLAYTFMVLGSFAIVALVGPASDGSHDISTLPRAVEPAPRAGVHVHRLPARAGRRAAHLGVLRQVLCDRGRRRLESRTRSASSRWSRR